MNPVSITNERTTKNVFGSREIDDFPATSKVPARRQRAASVSQIFHKVSAFERYGRSD